MDQLGKVRLRQMGLDRATLGSDASALTPRLSSSSVKEKERKDERRQTSAGKVDGWWVSEIDRDKEQQLFFMFIINVRTSHTPHHHQLQQAARMLTETERQKEKWREGREKVIVKAHAMRAYQKTVVRNTHLSKHQAAYCNNKSRDVPGAAWPTQTMAMFVHAPLRMRQHF